MKLPEIVLYTVAGLQRYALVFGSNLAAIDHLGENEEPTLNLAFFAPEREPGSASARIGYEPTVYKAYDVVHASHEFSEEFKLKNGLQTPAQIASIRGAGEWTEAPELVADGKTLQLLYGAQVEIVKLQDELKQAREMAAVLKQPVMGDGGDMGKGSAVVPELMTLERARSLMVQVSAGDGSLGAAKSGTLASPVIQPSADDLDHVEAEEKARVATSGEPAPSQESGDPWSEEKKAASDPASPTYPQIL